MAEKTLSPRPLRGPLRVMFVTTSLDVGGMETLLVNLIHRIDLGLIEPELCCLKHRGVLGEQLSEVIPVHADLLCGKYDLRVLPRLTRLLREREIDAVVTVGTGGDKMFWGRIAARRAQVPVVLSALHSTGLPDRVERMNRLLVPWTDGFIAVAQAHGEYIARAEGCPPAKVFVVPNGVDVEVFQPQPPVESLRQELRIPSWAGVVGIVAALRPEKNHEMFLRVAARVLVEHPRTVFVVVGDGARREELEALRDSLGLREAVRFLGTRRDIRELLSIFDVSVLTSKMEANPVSILEAMACGKPVVAPCVGSIPESVTDGVTGYLSAAGNEGEQARRIVALLRDKELATRMGREARLKAVSRHSIEQMVEGYERLIAKVYDQKVEAQRLKLAKQVAQSAAPSPPPQTSLAPMVEATEEFLASAGRR